MTDETDPVGQSLRSAFNALDELMVLASQQDTRAEVCREKVALGQLLTRCQLLAAFALAADPIKLKVVHG